MMMVGLHWWSRSLCGQHQPRLPVAKMKLDEPGNEIANETEERYLRSLKVSYL